MDTIKIDTTAENVGNIKRVYFSLRSATTGDLTDPSTATAKIEKPDGTLTTYNIGTGITAVSTGRWYFDITFDQAGTWNVEISTSGAAAAMYDFRVVVPEKLIS